MVDQYGDLTLEEARESIFEDCSSDDGEPEEDEEETHGATVVSLDAYCGLCPWENANLTCDNRLSFIEQNYYLSNEKVITNLNC